MPIKVLTNPVKSISDKKDYRVIELPNGLRALLISDKRVPLETLDEEERLVDATVAGDGDDSEEKRMEEEDEASDDADGEEESGDDGSDGEDDEENEASDKNESEDDVVDLGHTSSKKHPSTGLKKSAAGLCVGMGSLADPEELPGLAHFLEHMVFMGSKKYPDENAFDKFVHKHGGTDNAHTDLERTCFYFESHRKHFRECLDRFSQFFIEPLLKKEAMQREREAVDSEFQMALPDDYCRKQQIFGSFAKPGHPNRKFFWGNLESLQLAKYDDEKVHGMLRDFKNRHYVANSMTLTIQSQHDLDTLQTWVEESFGGVPSSDQPKASFGHLLEPFETPDFHRMYKVAPIQNTYQLDLHWAFPPLMDKYRTKPLNYLSYIIGHEGEGSLISYLRKKVWAMNLCAGNEGDGFDFNTTGSLFNVNIVLTKSGHENIREVMKAVFSYLKMLRETGPTERIYHEISEIERLSFDYCEEQQPLEHVEKVCEAMQYLPSDLYLAGDHLLYDYDPALISECMSRLDANNVNIMMLAREFKDICTKTEPWFRTSYTDEDIPAEWKEDWRTVEVFPEFFLPAPNRFIAEDTSLKSPMGDPQDEPYPVKIIDEHDGELFYRKDEIFKQPRATIYFHLYSPLVAASVENAVCLDIMVECLIQQMIEDVYPAETALLHYSFYAGERGIIIKLNGLNDKLPLLLETILSHFAQFEARLTDDMFKAVCDQLKKNYYNNFIKPMKLVRELRLFVLQDIYRTTRQKHSAIDACDKAKVSAFANAFVHSSLYVQALVQGNITRDEAIKLYRNARNLIGPQNPDKLAKVMKQRCNAIEPGQKYVRVNTFNPKDSNTVITNYYQDKPGTLQSLVHLEIGCMLMSEPCFDILRTKEQLGYSVFSMIRNTYGVIGVSITVNSQATKFTAEHVDSRIEAFVDWFTDDKLANLSDEDFNHIVTSLIKAKKTSDVTLEEEASRNWSEIISGEYFFGRFAAEIRILEGCEKEAMVNYMKSFLKRSESRRKLSVQVVGNANALNKEGCKGGSYGDEVANGDDVDATFNLTYIPNEGEQALPEEVVVTDLEAFKSSLRTYPVLHIVE